MDSHLKANNQSSTEDCCIGRTKTHFLFIVCGVNDMNYRKIRNISRNHNTSPNHKIQRILVSLCSCYCPIHWSNVLSSELRCSWSSADRRSSSYIWVINNFIAYSGATCIRGLTVCLIVCVLFPASISQNPLFNVEKLVLSNLLYMYIVETLYDICQNRN